MFRFRSHFAVCACLLTAGFTWGSAARAQSSTEAFRHVLSEPGSAGLGAITRFETSPYRGSNNRYDVLPLYLFEGERVFLDANRAGVKLINGADQRLDLFAAQRLEGFPSDRMPTSLAGMALRESGIDLGLSWQYRQPWGNVQAEFLHDANNTSKGNELRLGYSYDWRSGPWHLRPSLSVALRDARLNNYYYGVRGSEATPDRPAYAPGAGINAIALKEGH